MKNKQILGIGIVVVLLLATLLYVLYFSEDRYSWYENYELDSNDPYSTKVLYETLKNGTEGDFYEVIGSIEETVAKDSFTCPANYIFVGNEPYLNSWNVDALLNFAEAGNNVFISSNYLPSALTEVLDIDGCDTWYGYSMYKDTAVVLNFMHPAFISDTGFRYSYLYEKDTTRYTWKYLNTNDWCDYETPAIRLGSLDTSLVNFIQIPWGEGQIYLHTTPIAFTNLYMIEPSGYNYFNTVMSHMPNGDVIWDEIAHDPLQELEQENQRNHGAPDTPLQFILSQQSLRWAWYLTIVAVLLYLFFHMKRRQRAIPLIVPYENTSIEYAHTLGELHFLSGDHYKIAQKMMRSFQYHIRQRYKINTDLKWEEYIKTLSSRSSVPEHILKQLFKKFESMQHEFETRQQKVSEEDLIALYKLIQHFHKNSK